MDAERYADIFARAATTGERDELSKVASEFTKAALGLEDLKGAMGNPAVQNALIGAGVGGLFGAATGKKKLRSALGYGLLGGLGGLGVSALTGGLGGEKKPNLLAALAPGDRGAVSTGEGNPIAATGLGAVGGGLAGRAAGGAVGNAVARRQNELSRFIDTDHRLAKSVGDLEQFAAGGPGTDKTVAQFKNDAFKAWTNRSKNNPFVGAGMPTVGSAQDAIDDVARAMGADRLAFMPATRRAQLESLTRVIKARGGKSVTPAVLDRAIRSVPIPAGARLPRVGRGAGALLGILLGGMAGAHANRASVLNAQQQAAGAQ